MPNSLIRLYLEPGSTSIQILAIINNRGLIGTYDNTSHIYTFFANTPRTILFHIDNHRVVILRMENNQQVVAQREAFDDNPDAIILGHLQEIANEEDFLVTADPTPPEEAVEVNDDSGTPPPNSALHEEEEIPELVEPPSQNFDPVVEILHHSPQIDASGQENLLYFTS